MPSHINFPTKVPAPTNGRGDRPLSQSGKEFKGAGYHSYDHYVPLLTPSDDESREAEAGEGQPYPDTDKRYLKRGPGQSL